MVPTYVVDASVVLKWLASDREFLLDKAHTLFIKSCAGDINLIAPIFLKVELSNVLLNKKKFKPAEIIKFLSLLNQTHLIFIPETTELIQSAIKLASRYKLSVYDGLYLAIAKDQNLSLISADEKHHGRLKSCLLLKDLP